MKSRLEGPTFQTSSNCGPFQYSTSQIQKKPNSKKKNYNIKDRCCFKKGEIMYFNFVIRCAGYSQQYVKYK